MPPTRGTAPSFLSAESLVGMLLLYDAETIDSFPITKLFGPFVPYSKNKLILKIVEIQEKVGKFSLGPPEARSTELEQFSEVIAQALFQAEGYQVPPGHFANEDVLVLLSDAGISTDMIPPEILGLTDEARRELIGAIVRRFNVMRRTYEQLAINTLCESSFNVVLRDGATEAIDFWNLQTDTAAASWEAAATDIIGEFEEWMADYKEMSGGPPDIVLVSPRFHQKYIVGNTNLLEFLQRNPEFIRSGMRLGPDVMSKAADATFEVRVVQPRYLSAGVRTNMWTEDYMVFGRAPEATLQNATIRTPDNENNGGFWAHPVVKNRAPRGVDVETTHNGLPMLLDWTQWKRFDLVP